MANDKNPLEYQSKGAAAVEPAAADAVPAAAPASVVPAEFETLLTSTTDHGAAQAIRLALETAGIEVVESNDGASVGRVMKLFIRPADADTAGPIAASVFARRQKFRTFPKPRTDLPSTGSGLVLDPTDLLF